MAISFTTILVALRLKAGAVVAAPLTPRPLYRILDETRDVFRVAADEFDTYRGRSTSQVTHRVSRLETAR